MILDGLQPIICKYLSTASDEACPPNGPCHHLLLQGHHSPRGDETHGHLKSTPQLLLLENTLLWKALGVATRINKNQDLFHHKSYQQINERPIPWFQSDWSESSTKKGTLRSKKQHYHELCLGNLRKQQNAAMPLVGSLRA